MGVPTGANVVKVIDESGRELGPGEPGELVGYSPAVMTGYLNQPDKTSETQWRDADGRVFIRSGDVAVIDEDGFVTLIGRKKDMIISGGFNVYPVDLEKALLAHPDVDEAAVVAAPSREWGETPVAFVSLRGGSSVDAQTLRDFATIHWARCSGSLRCASSTRCRAAPSERSSSASSTTRWRQRTLSPRSRRRRIGGIARRWPHP